ncbi:MAG: septum site-determining protein MinC [Lachnospiraceae bacterium]|nr:septum site-determining protein MinC [Lachnospiraceae bacterium]MCR5477914.1 septum site-determining protein MinC [Lachnospiraceae bacterium]
MKSKVTVKSHNHGIRLILDPQEPFDALLAEIEHKFTESRGFLGKQSLVLSVEGRTLSDLEEEKVLAAIEKCCDLEIICVVGHDDKTEQNFLHAIRTVEQKIDPDNQAFFFRGSLTDHREIEVEESVVILGDVNPGSSIVSKGNIVVLGGLYGTARAGGATDESAFVIALEMQPEELIIGGVIYTPEEKGHWMIKPKVAPKLAHVSEGRILTDPLTRTLVERLYAV